MQDNTLYRHLTVRETFLIAAAMRLPLGSSPAVQKAAAEKAMLDLGLAKTADTRIGTKGLLPVPAQCVSQHLTLPAFNALPAVLLIGIKA